MIDLKHDNVDPALAMECWLAGAFALDGDALLGRALALRFTGPPLWRLLRRRRVTVTGEICADAFAVDRALQGEVTVAAGRVSYQLAFTNDAGVPCELACTQDLVFGRSPQLASIVGGAILERGRPIGRARLRLDPRNGIQGIFSWA